MEYCWFVVFESASWAISFAIRNTDENQHDPMFEQKVDHFNVNYEMNIHISFQFYHNNNRMQYRLLQFGKEKQTNWKNNERKENKIISLLLLVLYISHFIFLILYFSFHIPHFIFLISYFLIFSFYISQFIFLISYFLISYFLILYFSFYIFLISYFSFYISHFIFSHFIFSHFIFSHFIFLILYFSFYYISHFIFLNLYFSFYFRFFFGILSRKNDTYIEYYRNTYWLLLKIPNKLLMIVKKILIKPILLGISWKREKKYLIGITH